jgi:hypothetical protein
MAKKKGSIGAAQAGAAAVAAAAGAAAAAAAEAPLAPTPTGGSTAAPPPGIVLLLLLIARLSAMLVRQQVTGLLHKQFVPCMRISHCWLLHIASVFRLERAELCTFCEGTDGPRCDDSAAAQYRKLFSATPVAKPFFFI